MHAIRGKLRIDVMRFKGERYTAFAPKDNYRFRLTSTGDCYFGSSNSIGWVFLHLLPFHGDCETARNRLSLTNDAVRNVNAFDWRSSLDHFYFLGVSVFGSVGCDEA